MARKNGARAAKDGQGSFTNDGVRTYPNPSPAQPSQAQPWYPGEVLPSADPYAAPIDPLQIENKLDAVNIKFRDIPAMTTPGGWTWQGIEGALATHMTGNFIGSAMLCDTMMGDDRIQEALGSRVSALFGLPTVFTPAESDSVGTVSEAWESAYQKLGGSASTESVLSELKRWALMIGFGLAEIQWDTTQSPWQPILKIWNPQFVYFDWVSRCLVVNTQDGPVPIVPGNGRWFIHAPHGIYRGWVQGAVRGLAIPWIARNWATKDWIRCSEVHGLPMRIAETPAMASAPDKDRFQASLQASVLGREAVIVCPTNVDGSKFDVRLLEAHNNSWEIFRGLIDRSDTAITLVLKWQTLTTQVSEGSFAAAQIHANVEQGALEFDNESLAHDLRQQVARPFAAWNFGDADKAPWTSHDVQPQEDVSAKCVALGQFSQAVSALTAAGVVVDVEKLAKAYGLPFVPATMAPKPEPEPKAFP